MSQHSHHHHSSPAKTGTGVNWLVVGIFVFLALVVVALLASSPLTSTQSPRPSPTGAQLLAAAETVFDFGTIAMANGKVTKVFAIKNPNNQPVTIQRIYTSCMCTTATLVLADKRFGPFGMPGHGVVPKINQTLAPGAEANLEVEFDPAAHGPAGIGLIERDVFVESSDGGQLALTIRAQVTP